MKYIILLLPILFSCGISNDLTPPPDIAILKPNYNTQKDSCYIDTIYIDTAPITRQQRLAQKQTQKHIRKMYDAESTRLKQQLKEDRKRLSDSLDFLISHYEILIDQIKLETKEEIKRLRLDKRMYSDSIKGANKSLKTVEKKQKKSYWWAWMLVGAFITLVLVLIVMVLFRK